MYIFKCNPVGTTVEL